MEFAQANRLCLDALAIFMQILYFHGHLFGPIGFATERCGSPCFFLIFSTGPRLRTARELSWKQQVLLAVCLQFACRKFKPSKADNTATIDNLSGEPGDCDLFDAFPSTRNNACTWLTRSELNPLACWG
jgi:hypothetical protein